MILDLDFNKYIGNYLFKNYTIIKVIEFKKKLEIKKLLKLFFRFYFLKQGKVKNVFMKVSWVI